MDADAIENLSRVKSFSAYRSCVIKLNVSLGTPQESPLPAANARVRQSLAMFGPQNIVATRSGVGRSEESWRADTGSSKAGGV